jgi:hypothetical protein
LGRNLNTVFSTVNTFAQLFSGSPPTVAGAATARCGRPARGEHHCVRRSHAHALQKTLVLRVVFACGASAPHCARVPPHDARRTARGARGQRARLKKPSARRAVSCAAQPGLRESAQTFRRTRQAGIPPSTPGRVPRGCIRACLRTRSAETSVSTSPVRPRTRIAPLAGVHEARHGDADGRGHPPASHALRQAAPQTTPAAQGGRSGAGRSGEPPVSRLPRAARRRRPGRACR